MRANGRERSCKCFRYKRSCVSCRECSLKQAKQQPQAAEGRNVFFPGCTPASPSPRFFLEDPHDLHCYYAGIDKAKRPLPSIHPPRLPGNAYQGQRGGDLTYDKQGEKAD